ncbi:MAG: hypothetical protein GWP05_05775 [Anaerolineaceae bacterium]|nr:hypothetical protein [Anaerolineaceae bacterium]
MKLVTAILIVGTFFAGHLSAAQAPTISDPKDKQIVEGFLKQAMNMPRNVSAAASRKMAAEECEGITWRLLPQVSMPLTAYEVTGDAKYLDVFVTAFENLRGAMTKGQDGYLGWYGKALKGFQDPNDPDKKVDVIINSFRAADLLGRFLELTAADPALTSKYATQRKAYADLAANHLVRKWTARGNYTDLGKYGAIYRTHRGLEASKGNLTQPHNKHSIIIRGLLSLYRATGDDELMRMAVKLGTRYKRSLTLKNGHYEWNYWDPAGQWDVLPGASNKWKHWIGVEHKGSYYSSTLTQAVVLYQHGVVFDKTDLERFLKTQLKMVWNGSLDNPRWARCDGTTSDKYMQGRYMCGALAPFSEKVAEFIYTGARQNERVKNVNHSWQGGPVANGWIAGKFVTLPKARGGKQIYLEARTKFLKKKSNRDFLKSLEFKVTGSGYKAPRKPSEMKPMPRAGELK